MTNQTHDHKPSARRAMLPVAALLATAALFSGCGESPAPEATPSRTEPAAQPASDAPSAGSASNTEAPGLSLEAALIAGDDEAVLGHIAAAMGRADAVRALVDAGASLETRNGSGVTPAFNAAFFCHAEALRVLIDAGAETATTDQNGTPIADIMATPWEQMRPVYAMVHASVGLPFDAERIELARPEIEAMLR